ncbi:hypothetical protein [Chloroflexus aggregans]|uniref:Uncharacterized protein n=1 Tax=Chloroflexus aggregans (strain MD-66 / DSM 9485) TaxID=326427 RepID=B8G8S4_CHLAD|nr:hypothetical protein [Chloroflexus aggregans]ACL24336.1 hypothetical protein Cagg_1429 [Chloroflexus aggregans DSM 9485]
MSRYGCLATLDMTEQWLLRDRLLGHHEGKLKMSRYGCLATLNMTVIAS